MKKVIKWVAIGGGSLFLLIILAFLIIPKFVDIQKYKPEIEKKVAEAIGRPFTLGGDINLSLFPWAGLSFSDLHLGNPPGFKGKDFLSVKSFELRVKLIPLILKEIQVKRFVLDGPRIFLERRKDGLGNWEGIGKLSDKATPKPQKEEGKPSKSKPGANFPIKSLAVDEFAITNGFVQWNDHIKGGRKEVSDLALRLSDVSLDRPIHIAFAARLDNRPLSLEGDVGPLGKEPGKISIPLDLAVKVLEQVDVNLKGKIVEPITRQEFDLAVKVSPFSPRKLMAALGQTFPITTSDPKALNLVALSAKLKGDPKNVSVSDGTLDMDDSKLNFSTNVKEFSRPDVTFDLNLDQIDLDKYLSPPSEKKSDEENKKIKTPTQGQKKIDYTLFRRLLLDGTIRVGKLKAHGAKIQDFYLKISGKNGLFHLDPITLNLYQGDVSSKGILDVREEIPKSNIEIQAKGIQAGPMLKDLLKKDFLEGILKSEAAIRMTGDNPERIKRTLNGKGDLLFNDGAIVGIDLAGMVRNVKATFGLDEKNAKKPRTDFAELHTPFTITNGVLDTPGTSLMSPFLRVTASGKADLVNEALDFIVEPKFVTTIKGQGDSMQRSGLMVPVLITGTFSSPKFRPDLKGMFEKKFKGGISGPSDLKKIIKGEGSQTDQPASITDKTKGLKGVFFGQ